MLVLKQRLVVSVHINSLIFVMGFFVNIAILERKEGWVGAYHRFEASFGNFFGNQRMYVAVDGTDVYLLDNAGPVQIQGGCDCQIVPFQQFQVFILCQNMCFP
eukprot:TRINITY_DN19003_c0_g1_i6.p7 TRINITY_DN19003_c0_g1~~TRINITY_DN19003_c0_g1_i6.p7  ORF type:complete len:103 (-),score=4.71 TRINITY_DN19003_c0_g1_i6:432-740(-)